MSDTVLDFALRYARAGHPVLPLHRVIDGKCTCGTRCKTPGKHPRTEHGAGDASKDEKLIRRWFTKCPDANIGITLDGHVVVDADPRNGCDVDALASKMPETCNALTGGGGKHWLFRTVNGSRYNGKLGPGVDIKHGARQYIVVEPSIHPSGEKYVWLDESEPWSMKAAVAPEFLAAAPKKKNAERGSFSEVDVELLRDLRSALTAMRSDDRDTWVDIGHALKTIGDQGRALWLEWSQTSDKYDAADAARVWDSLKPTAIGHQAVFAAAQAAGWVNPAKGKPKARTRTDTPAHVIEPIPDDQPRDQSKDQPKQPSRIAIRRAFEVAQKPQYAEWLLRPYLERNVLALMFGELGTLKSFTALEFALTIGSGEPSRALPDAQVHGGNVLYVSAEGKGLWRRLKAWSIARGIHLEDVRLWVIEQPVDLYSQQSLLELAEQINGMKIEPVLIVIDTLSRNCGAADENKSADMTAFLNGIDKLLRVPFGCSVLLVHHVGHMEKGRARGAYVLMANTDANYLIERPDPNRMLIEVKTGRLKDSESPPTVCMEARVVELGTVDEDDRPETSLVLVSTAEKPTRPRRSPTGKNQLKAFNAIGKAIEAGQTLLQAEAVRLVITECGLPRNRALETVTSLIEGAFLKPGPMGPLEMVQL